MWSNGSKETPVGNQATGAGTLTGNLTVKPPYLYYGAKRRIFQSLYGSGHNLDESSEFARFVADRRHCCGARTAKWWLGAESNRRHKDFQSSALPTELPSRTSGTGIERGRVGLGKI